MPASRIVRRILAGLAALTLLALTLALVLYLSVRHVPAFYRRALGEPAGGSAAGDEFERRVLALRNDARRRGAWRAEFSERQINAWLAEDLPEKLPRLLPPEVRDPRVVIEAGSIKAACRYQGDGLTTVIWLDMEVHLSDQPNEVAVCIRRARAGLAPLPQKALLDEIQRAALAAGLPLRWAQDGGDPVALIGIPAPEGAGPAWRIQSLELAPARVVLSGRTGSAPSDQ